MKPGHKGPVLNIMFTVPYVEIDLGARNGPGSAPGMVPDFGF